LRWAGSPSDVLEILPGAAKVQKWSGGCQHRHVSIAPAVQGSRAHTHLILMRHSCEHPNAGKTCMFAVISKVKYHRPLSKESGPAVHCRGPKVALQTALCVCNPSSLVRNIIWHHLCLAPTLAGMVGRIGTQGSDSRLGMGGVQEKEERKKKKARLAAKVKLSFDAEEDAEGQGEEVWCSYPGFICQHLGTFL
jgi:hypothetical protein